MEKAPSTLAARRMARIGGREALGPGVRFLLEACRCGCSA
jgi:hypothetical protein